MEQNSCLQVQEKRVLYLIMSERGEHQYGLYRIEEPKLSCAQHEDEAIIRDLGKPLFEMDRSTFPKLMAFAAVDSRIFMVGGLEYDLVNQRYRHSKKVFTFDTKLSTLSPGPELISPKSNSHLITLGSKLFVLSNIISSLDREPRFEMLDTLDLGRGWSALPLPQLFVDSTTVDTLAAVVVGGGGSCSGGLVVLSSSPAGTYVFDVDNQLWDYVTDEPLPFEGTATSLPLDPITCCGYSLKSERFCAFRFCYGGDEGKRTFRVEEINIDDTDSLSPPLPPEIIYRPRQTIPGPHGLFYFVDTGVDRELSYTLIGDRYVQVSALQLSATKTRHTVHMVVDEDEDETTKVQLNKKPWIGFKSCTTNDGVESSRRSKRGRGRGRQRQKGRVQEEEANEFMLTRIWRRSFFGGPVCDPLLHVVAAFAM